MATYGPGRQGYMERQRDIQNATTYDPDEGTIVSVGGPVRGREHLPVSHVEVDTDGDGVADKTLVATKEQIRDQSEAGHLQYGQNGREGAYDGATTDYTPPASLSTDRAEVQSPSGASFGGETVTVSHAAFTQFLGRLGAIPSTLTTDHLAAIDVGPGSTPMGLELKRKLNTESGEITKSCILAVQNLRDNLNALHDDLTAAAAHYKEGEKQIELNAQQLGTAFDEAIDKQTSAGHVSPEADPVTSGGAPAAS